jgi:hypothetical protein
VTKTREGAFAALYTTIAAAYPWGVSSRRMKMWTDVPTAQRPAFYQLEAGAETYSWAAQPNPKRTIEAKLFLYFSTPSDGVTPGASAMNAALDAIDAALAPSPGAQFQTLGGTCFSARVTSVPVRDTGDIDGDALAVVIVQIILP